MKKASESHESPRRSGSSRFSPEVRAREGRFRRREGSSSNLERERVIGTNRSGSTRSRPEVEVLWFMIHVSCFIVCGVWFHESPSRSGSSRLRPAVDVDGLVFRFVVCGFWLVIFDLWFVVHGS